MNDHIVNLMGSLPLNFLTVLLLFLFFPALGAGGRRLIRLKLADGSFLIDFSLGFGLTGLLALLLAKPLIALPAAVPGLLLGIPTACYWGYRLKQGWPEKNRLFSILRFHAPALMLLLSGGLFMLASALLPPYGWDEQTYQLALPVRWLADGSAAATADNPYSAFPSLPQFVFLAAIKLGGLGTVRLLVWAVYLLIFWNLYQELRTLLSRPAAIVLTGIFAFAPVTGVMMRITYVEVFVLLNLLAALRLRRLLPEREKWPAAAGFGLLAGFTAAVKLTALGGAAAILVAAFPSGHRRTGRVLPVVLLVALAAGGLFYLRPWIDLGNPVYPFASALFAPDNPVPAAVEKFHRDLGRSHYGLQLPLGIFTGFLAAAFDEQLFEGIVMGWQFPLLLLLGTAGLYLARKRRIDWPDPAIPVMLLVLYMFWIFSSQQTRFLFPAFPPALLFAAQAMTLWNTRKTRLCCVLALLLGTAISFNLRFFLHFYQAWGLLGIARTEPARLLALTPMNSDYLHALAFLQRQTPAGARILLVFERRSLYSPRRTFNGTPCFQGWIMNPPPESPAELLADLRRRKIDYLLVAAPQQGIDYLPEYDPVFEKFDRMLMQLTAAGQLEYLPNPDSGHISLLRVPGDQARLE